MQLTSASHVESKTTFSLVLVHPSSFLHFFSAKIYRHKTCFSLYCCPNWPHGNIQTTTGSIWLLSTTDHSLFSVRNCEELQREANSDFLSVEKQSPEIWDLWKRMGHIEGAAEYLRTMKLLPRVF